MPNYRHLEIVVNEQIAKMVAPNQPVVFTWMESDLSHEEISDLIKNPMRPVKDSSSINSFEWIKYPRVDYEYFQHKKHDNVMTTNTPMTLSQRIINTFMNLLTVCDKGNYDQEPEHVGTSTLN